MCDDKNALSLQLANMSKQLTDVQNENDTLASQLTNTSNHLIEIQEQESIEQDALRNQISNLSIELDEVRSTSTFRKLSDLYRYYTDDSRTGIN